MNNKKQLQCYGKRIFTFISLITMISISFAQVVNDFLILNDVKVDKNTIQIITSGAVKYNVFKIANPPRLVAELINTEHNIKQKELLVNSDVIKRIRSGQFQNEPKKIARIVIDLIKMVDYETNQSNNIINISLVDKKTNELTTQSNITEIAAAIPPPPTENNTITPVAQSDSEQKNTEPEPVQTNDSEQPVKEKQNAIVATNPGPEKSITTKKVSAVTKPSQKQAKKSKTSKTTESASKSSINTQKKELSLPKTLVTLEYQDADIKDVLQVMSIRSGINIIYGPDVIGNVTISLRDVPFDQAFNTILALKSLTSTTVGSNIIRVITPSALKEERQKDITFTKIYPLNYAEAGTIQGQISSVLSAREIKGNITTDQRTNSLVVTASPEGLLTVEKLLEELDVKPQQVMIEARIVDVSLNDLNELGVNWSLQKLNSEAGTGAATGAQTQTIGKTLNATQDGISASGKVQVMEAASIIPVPTSGGTFNFGYVTNREAFNARLGALISEGRAKVLSNPRVTTLNNKEASIMSGEKVPYKKTSVNATGTSQESWDFLDAGVSLTVTPTISPEGWVTLKVAPSVRVPLAAPAGQLPPIRSRETNVTVMVKDDDTLVIGGLITENDSESISKIPILGDLPILGYIFKYKSNNKQRTELLVFITPKILPD
ncbi:MAG: hypothetical protein A2252_03270 [Elusimicrobia bacterium RIFOXYA2_FULL_39_19]|nr:MAG: hypothetical protein A2252_03270 [Elusimicrobia bacterium RIFOXYA2_FULL_39_19]